MRIAPPSALAFELSRRRRLLLAGVDGARARTRDGGQRAPSLPPPQPASSTPPLDTEPPAPSWRGAKHLARDPNPFFRQLQTSRRTKQKRGRRDERRAATVGGAPRRRRRSSLLPPPPPMTPPKPTSRFSAPFGRAPPSFFSLPLPYGPPYGRQHSGRESTGRARLKKGPRTGDERGNNKRRRRRRPFFPSCANGQRFILPLRFAASTYLQGVSPRRQRVLKLFVCTFSLLTDPLPTPTPTTTTRESLFFPFVLPTPSSPHQNHFVFFLFRFAARRPPFSEAILRAKGASRTGLSFFRRCSFRCFSLPLCARAQRGAAGPRRPL